MLCTAAILWRGTPWAPLTSFVIWGHLSLPRAMQKSSGDLGPQSLKEIELDTQTFYEGFKLAGQQQQQQQQQRQQQT